MSTRQIQFDYYKDVPPIRIPDENLLGIYQPRRIILTESEEEVIKKGIQNPIGTSPISKMVRRGQKVLIIADDNTRLTPARKILPFIMEELEIGGVRKRDIKILIALGTHRTMTYKEIIEKFGRNIYESYEIINHEWKNKNQLRYIGDTPSGIRVSINKAVLETDFLIGLGQIIPHRIAGFSGGAKIIQPGVSGAETTASTHWQAALLDGRDIMGVADNPIRREMEKMAEMVGLKVIVNAVQDSSGRIIDLVVGDPVKAHRKGVEVSKGIYSVEIPSTADIVVVDSYPADLEFWQACKGVYAADFVVKKGGVIILVTPCPEGIANQHPCILDFGYLLPERAKKLIKEGILTDLIAGAHLVQVGKTTVGKAKLILVSQGIGKKIAEKVGFLYAETPQDALEKAFALREKSAKVIVMKCGGGMLPIVGSP